ncbi:MAG: type I restriction endonuclease subunit R [Candidatus Aminicenantes bacterium]|nr:MAG: type I restriction endonuclease subunit R [Candidatus Aminicenantes bacterium]
MYETPVFKEDHISQIPAIQLLVNLGYTYITPEETKNQRSNKMSRIILEKILEQQLRKINTILYKENQYQFSNNNFNAAVEAVKHIPYEGLIHSAEKLYDLISLGKSFKETIQGSTKSFSFKYIDWENISNNAFHVTAEFEIERDNQESTRRLDIVLFVNGIPFVIIECKRPDIKDSISLTIKQHLRNQQRGEIPKLFVYTQLLMAINKNEAQYATTGTEETYWTTWQDQEPLENQLKRLINQPLPMETKDKIFSSRFRYARRYFDELETAERQVTAQDRAVFSLCRPERLMELGQRYILFDRGEKKIARYQQYFAVKKILRRIKNIDPAGKRQGGVIWHVQGSGKSLAMVMMAKGLAMEPDIPNPRIVLVTDRINLDDQICTTFKHCGMKPVMAKTGNHLIRLLESEKKTIITTVINKFNAAFNKKNFTLGSPNIFVLVDESHRTQYGIANARMMRVLPNACYLGFTGTPLKKRDKNTAIKFGGFIDKYPIDKAVKDKAIVPLLYEGRHVLQKVNKKPIDKWVDRICAPLTPYQTADLKKKFSNPEKLNSAEQRILEIAYDINEHFKKNWKDTGFKAQLVAPSKADAIKYNKFLDQMGDITSEVLISPPNVQEGLEDIYDKENAREVKRFWEKMMDKYGSEKNYNKILKDAFRDHEEPEIIIVVHKLLTGYDAPRNTILYVTRNLFDHTLLQAIARVNRIYPGKEYGFIIDYRGILLNLDRALTEYRALSEFDEEDLEGTLLSIYDTIKTLPQKYSQLWDIFKSIPNKQDEQAYEDLLYDEALRYRFYEKLAEFSKLLSIALSTTNFYKDTEDRIIYKYKEDLHFFTRLRESVKKRYAETVDFKEYEVKFQKLLDTYVEAEEVVQVTPQVNIFNKEEFEKEVEQVAGKGAKADRIAHRTKRSIEEKYDEDPVFYKKFSTMLEETIQDYHNQRLAEAEYLKKVTHIMESVRNKTDENLPPELRDNDKAAAFYRVSHEVIEKIEKDKKRKQWICTEIAQAIDDIILKHQVVDWHLKQDIQNVMLNEMEEFLYKLKDFWEVDLSYDDIDLIMETTLGIAKKRMASAA